MLSQFQLHKDQREKLSSILREQREQPCILHVDVKSRKIKKQPQKNEKPQLRYVHSYGNNAVYSDAMCFDQQIDYFEHDAMRSNKLLLPIQSAIIKENNKKRDDNAKSVQIFKRQVFIWFYQESLRPKPQQPIPSKRTFLRQMITVKSDQTDGIQVHGTILTKDGFKITYPNVSGIIKMSSLWEQPQKVQIQKSFYQIKVSNHLTMIDDMDDLTNYVWKVKFYHQFFKLLLKFSIGNLEIKDVLVKMADKLKTSHNHTFLFYQISSKPWGMAGMIKDLNKRGLFPRERKEMLDTMLGNISDDLHELFKQCQEPIIPQMHIFVSFKEYVKWLQQMMQKRVN